MASKRLCGVIAAALCTTANVAAAQTAIQLGDNYKLGYFDNGNAGLLLSDGPWLLDQMATLNALHFWVGYPAGELILAIYEAGPAGNCKGGALRAQTDIFVPVHGWNTRPPAASTTLPRGKYCLAYEPSDDGLSFRKGIGTGINNTFFANPWPALPATFAANPQGGDGFHWSLYATLTAGPPAPVISFVPPGPAVAATAPRGTVVATINVAMSDGSAFTGLLGFGAPYYDDGGRFALSGYNVIVNPAGPGLAAAANSTQDVTVVASQ